MDFKSKSQTLSLLSSRLRAALILDQVVVEVGDWRHQPDMVLKAIASAAWADQPMIVRSSLSQEDSATHSLAGQFVSVRDVRTKAQLVSAIRAVIRSYGSFVTDREQILIQPQLQNVTMSGVALSRELGSGRPYIVINYSKSSDTAAVTAGHTNELEVYYHFRGAPYAPEGRLGAVLRMLQEVEEVTGCGALDIEFAFCQRDEKPVLLQARPLVNVPAVETHGRAHQEELSSAQRKLEQALGPDPLCFGKRSILGVMPDWNPAEIIGIRPRPLACSLYRNLVTDLVWSDQRRAYGYRDMRGYPLMVTLLGVPFIDVRASFNSFVPAALDDDAAGRLVDHYLERLLAMPSVHDKVEFQIVYSCYTFDLQSRLKALADHGFSETERGELEKALHHLTMRTFAQNGPWAQDRSAVSVLVRRRAIIAERAPSDIWFIYWMLEDSRRQGTRPFAGLARAGFMAIQILDSLTALGVLSIEDRRDFLMGVNTVTNDMQIDLRHQSRSEFLAKYGHLRPGTYDILSARYDEKPDLYFRSLRSGTVSDALRQEPRQVTSLRLSASQKREIQRLLTAHGFEWSAKQLLETLGTAIREREQAKFEFTRNLSDALARIAQWGAKLGFTLDDMSYASIDVIMRCYSTSSNEKAVLEESIETGRRAHAITMMTALPPLILSPRDVWGFHLPTAMPTFVTTKDASGPTMPAAAEQSLAGCIVMLPNADPGFDWIFSRGIAGFVTAYGGANSHMAIRASELDLPAVVGAGERLYSQWAAAPMLKLDCANRLVESLTPVPQDEAHRHYAAG